MPTYRKRGKRWQVEVYRKGLRRSATFDTKYECQEWARQVDLTPKGPETLNDAFNRYARTVSPTHKGERWEVIRLRLIGLSIGHIRLQNLTPNDLAEWRDNRLKEVTSGSVRREMNLIRSALEVARKEWGWIKVNPIQDVKWPASPPPRYQVWHEAEIESVLAQLRRGQKNQEVGRMFQIALETAMRMSEILNAKVSGRVAVLVDTKNNDRREVPLTKKAVELFSEPFTVKASTASQLFRKAARRAGIDHLTFHDSRATALTRLSKKLDILDLARMTGHRDPRSLMIYYRPSAQEIADRLDTD